MGYTSARDFADQASLDVALSWHLQANHFPPVPTDMVPVCKAAIEAAADGEWDTEIVLPDGFAYRDQFSAPVRAIVEAHHLDAFIDAELERREELDNEQD